MTDRESKSSDAELIAFLRAQSTGRPSAREGEDADPGQAAAVWEALGAVAEDPRIREMRAAARARLAANDETVSGSTPLGLSTARKPRVAAYKWLAIAASLALVLAAGLQFQAHRTPVAAWQAAAVLANGQAAPRSFRLADGSQVTLDAGSEVDVAASESERRLTLRKGRAFFDVAHDQAHPFIVTFGPSNVTALGTRFAVSQRRGDPLVLLERGRVRVAETNDSEKTELEPGQQLRKSSSGRYLVETTDAAKASQWTSGEITFDAMPASEVLAALSPYLKEPLATARSSDGGVKVSGTFQLGDDEGLKAALSAMNVEVVPAKAL